MPWIVLDEQDADGFGADVRQRLTGEPTGNAGQVPLRGIEPHDPRVISEVSPSGASRARASRPNRPVTGSKKCSVATVATRAMI